MSTVAQLLQRDTATETPHLGNRLPTIGFIGLELELEGSVDWRNINGWMRESDGSLRNGIEYVFEGPQGGVQAEASIRRMAEYLHNLEGLAPSFRCSTHIHMNVQDLELSQVEKLVFTYLMFEPVMFDHCALERRYSNFCTPMFINTNLTTMFGNMFLSRDREQDQFYSMTNWPKYSALNLKPMTEYGSVEFRGSHALTSEDDMMDLASRMLHLRRVVEAADLDVPTASFVEHLRNSPLEYVFPTGLIDGYVPEERMMDKAYSSALMLLNRSVTTRGESRPRRAEPLRRFSIRVNREAMERYNMFYPSNGAMEVSELIRMVVALRRITGLIPPRFDDFAPEWQRDIPAGQLIAVLTRVGVTTRDLGF